ncbi:Nn.00g038370.m01.CDS01 [Neocucurbitaria sp. VM-36]
MDRGRRHSGTTKSFNGCWTCRLRRKKCDENHPICDACAALHIVCHFDQTKPEWMNGGVRQEEMAERVKREVKEKAQLRREERAVHVPVDQASISDTTTNQGAKLPQNLPKCLPNPICDLRKTPDTQGDGMESYPGVGIISLQSGSDCMLLSGDTRDNMALGGSYTILFMFYHEHLLPFLFPFYRPSVFEGGKAWIMEMMMKSPVIRQTAFCQSSYFLSLARGTADNDAHWETVLAQTQEAFGMLRKALQIIDSAGIAEHLHGAVRILASIMQVQRFEIAVLSFDNCQAHLNAALAIFKQLLASATVVAPACPKSSFNAVMNGLGPSSWIPTAPSVQVPSAEQEAFRFSSALLVLDDIIASTVLQEPPKLYEYHRSLLGDFDDTEPIIKLEAIVGCQNWVLLQIGEIAMLDVWKQQCKQAELLDVMELVRRAAVIKTTLEAHLTQLETIPMQASNDNCSVLDVFTTDHGQYRRTIANQSTLVTRVWAHAALIYLFVVVSGWQPASDDIRYHVSRIVELLMHQISPPALLRGMVWPFCVAGCLAEPLHEVHFRGMVEALQPPGVFGTVRKALQIMDNVWRNRDAGDTVSRDLATCFRSQGDLVLLV